MGKRIIIMAGGTGGHVFPALAVAELLSEKGWSVSWLGTQKGLESRVVPEQGIEIDWLSVAGVRGKGLWSKITAIFSLFKACYQAARVLLKRKPDVVLGMGGFVAGPGGLMAKLLGIPLVIHEQNRVPGTTNRLLSKLANQVLEGFPGSFKQQVKAKSTGNPLRKKFLIAHKNQRQLPVSEVKLLILGGSQGAKILNETVPDAIAKLGGLIESQLQISVRHQTGESMLVEVRQHYKKLSIKSEINAFIEDMVDAYQWADLVVCRAGAMTVSEVAAMGVPAIFIPLPSAIDDHQMANARYLSDAGAGIILVQRDMNPKSLAECINSVLSELPQMSNAAKECALLDATQLVAEYCISEAV